MLSGTLYDVIIIGAGPGGSLTGYLLSLQRLKVLIVEKKKMPRYKPCAGGMTRRALNILPFDISDVVESLSYTVTISIQNKPVFIETDDHPIVTIRVPIFEVKPDRQSFLGLLQEVAKRFNWLCHAYCLMDNYHLLQKAVRSTFAGITKPQYESNQALCYKE